VGQGTKREQISIEQRELTLHFERTRITATIRIVHGSRFHLVACAEIASAARIVCGEFILGWTIGANGV
jgi:hypothetical protein